MVENPTLAFQARVENGHAVRVLKAPIVVNPSYLVVSNSAETDGGLRWHLDYSSALADVRRRLRVKKLHPHGRTIRRTLAAYELRHHYAGAWWRAVHAEDYAGSDGEPGISLYCLERERWSSSHIQSTPFVGQQHPQRIDAKGSTEGKEDEIDDRETE